jgi:unsaturated rhamnogalacturonyl hydrolase
VSYILGVWAALMAVDDGTIIDTKGWQGWEWTHGIALTALLHVRLSQTSEDMAEI